MASTAQERKSEGKSEGKSEEAAWRSPSRCTAVGEMVLAGLGKPPHFDKVMVHALFSRDGVARYRVNVWCRIPSAGMVEARRIGKDSFYVHLEEGAERLSLSSPELVRRYGVAVSA